VSVCKAVNIGKKDQCIYFARVSEKKDWKKVMTKLGKMPKTTRRTEANGVWGGYDS